MIVVGGGSVESSQLKPDREVGDVEEGCGLPFPTHRSRGPGRPVLPVSPDLPDRAVLAVQPRQTTFCWM